MVTWSNVFCIVKKYCTLEDTWNSVVAKDFNLIISASFLLGISLTKVKTVSGVRDLKSPSKYVSPTRKDGFYHKSRNLFKIKLVVQLKNAFHNKEDFSEESVFSFFLSVVSVLIQTLVVP